MIPVAKAFKIVDQTTGSIGTEKVDIASVVGRILRQDIIADDDLPPFAELMAERDRAHSMLHPRLKDAA